MRRTNSSFQAPKWSFPMSGLALVGCRAVTKTAHLHSWDYQTNHHHLWLQSLHFIHIISYPRVSLVLSNQPIVGPTPPPLQQSHIELCPRLLCCRPLYLSDRNISRVVVTNLPSFYVGNSVGICRRKSKNQHLLWVGIWPSLSFGPHH